MLNLSAWFRRASLLCLCGFCAAFHPSGLLTTYAARSLQRWRVDTTDLVSTAGLASTAPGAAVEQHPSSDAVRPASRDSTAEFIRRRSQDLPDLFPRFHHLLLVGARVDRT